MKKITLAAALVLAPTLAHAQSGCGGGAGVQVQSQTQVEASATSRHQSRLSAGAQAKVDADVRTAHDRHLPEEPISRRVAEGEAKGASEAQIVAASGRTLVELETAHDAIVGAGHRDPSNAEVTSGAQLVARGYTRTQLEEVARHAQADRSLVVAFETLTRLNAHGVSSTEAVAKVESKLAARASDADVRSLAGDANVGSQVESRGALNAGHGHGVAGSAAAGAGVAGAATGTVGRGVSGVAGGVTGGVNAGVVGGAQRP
jgi:hypothetical protein